eukprot:697752-Pyramimonas_sp.AAC.1
MSVGLTAPQPSTGSAHRILCNQGLHQIAALLREGASFSRLRSVLFTGVRTLTVDIHSAARLAFSLLL